MIPWSVVSQWSSANPPGSGLRSPRVQQEYAAFVQSLQLQGDSVESHIRRTILADRTAPWVLAPNLFPYDVSGCTHYVLWINTPYFPEPTDQQVQDALSDLHRPYAFFRNLPRNQTVQGIPHYHVFVAK